MQIPHVHRPASLALLPLFFTLALNASAQQDDRNTGGVDAQRIAGQPTKQNPHPIPGGFDLPNGWRITPAGKPIATLGDMVLNMVVSPDGRIVVANHSGYNPHGIDVFDSRTQKLVQDIALKTTWLGMTWSADSRTLYVSGGNATGAKTIDQSPAPIYEFTYSDGRLSEKPVGELLETVDPKTVWWSGLAYLPDRHVLYAANRGTGKGPSNIVAFDLKTRTIITRIPVAINPYQLVLTANGRTLFVSNWGSESVSVIDTATNRVVRTLKVGINPNDMKLSTDGRLFVACSNDNTVYVIDTRSQQVMERLSTTLTPLAPEGSTPDSLALDDMHKILYVANADNNSVAVVRIGNRAQSKVAGFIPTGWYPSALALTHQGRELYIGNSKGEEGHADLKGPESPLASKWDGDESVKTLQKSSVEVLPVAELPQKLPHWTKQVVDNTPYNDSLLSEARPPQSPTILPQAVGAQTPIRHVIYIIKENRTFDQVFGDLPHANGDPRLVIFGEKVTPNQHALARKYVILDNLYCDGEVSVDGHSWSDAAYATDFAERYWPPTYAGRSNAERSQAFVPSAGYLWDLARHKGLTYRSYGEYALRPSTGEPLDAAISPTLAGHISKDYIGSLQRSPAGKRQRDTDNVAIFLREFKEYEKNFDSPDAGKRFPNFVIMSMPEDHTVGTRPGEFTPQAMVANNDYAIGQLVDAVSHSRYWPNTAIFIIEDDAQDGPDHVDARRTVGLVISPYVKQGITDSTLYSTSSMVRSMELLLGLPPMSQYDAAAMPMYASFGTQADITPFNVVPPQIDVNAKNTASSYGAQESMKMDFSDEDRAPMHALNAILWRSIKGADAPVPSPVHRYRPLVETGKPADKD
jgi:YVTN family beta-propeller protein